ncbi:hypothetical protein [Teredinibacter sp. KSP-S5-2]|uniref:hypothetical protein n=1 Tax=Teredinibacter sp. KSP-S5-2 TaxID=3034506 RepID=UPI002934F83F|nr:hypothetical protein [Teredinibacter sp. KSP-S5-2]WNO09580.1 hypothetical protein P5V12_00095 [Teredinibacter sp. KSP-S5-2]
MQVSFTQLVIAGEIILTIIVALMVAALAFWKKSRKQEELIDSLQQLLQKELVKQIELKAKLQARHAEHKPVEVLPHDDTDYNSIIREQKEKLESYEKRLENLEKFKHLFFAAEERIIKYALPAQEELEHLIAELSSPDADEFTVAKSEDMAREALGLLVTLNSGTDTALSREGSSNAANRTPIADMFHQQKEVLVNIDVSGETANVDRNIIEYLQRLQRDTESHVKVLEVELAEAKSQAAYADIHKNRSKNLKSRIRVLEGKEKQNEETIYKQQKMISRLENRQMSTSDMSERIAERMETVESMHKTILEKERLLQKARQEYVNLEKEYESLFHNYESLINKNGNGGSLEDIERSIVDPIPDQLNDVDALKKELYEKKRELDRKNSECKLLEESYLELSKSNDELQSMLEELKRTKVEYQMLEEQLSKMTETGNAPQDTVALKKLSKQYNELEASYFKTTKELEELKLKEHEFLRMQREFSVLEQQLINVYEQRYSN